MVIEKLDFAEPFFSVKRIKKADNLHVSEKAIVLNLSETPIRIRQQKL